MKKSPKGLADLANRHLGSRRPLNVFTNAALPSFLQMLEADLGTPRTNVTSFFGEKAGVRLAKGTPFDFLLNAEHATFDLVAYYAETPAELLDVSAVFSAREMLSAKSVVQLQTFIPSDHRYRLQFASKLREYTSLEPQDFECTDSIEDILLAFYPGLIDAIQNPDDVALSTLSDLISAGVAHVFQQGRLNFERPTCLEKHPFVHEVRRDVNRVLATGAAPDFIATLFDIPHTVDEILRSKRYSKTWLDGNLGGITSNITNRLAVAMGLPGSASTYEPDDRIAMKLPPCRLDATTRDQAREDLRHIARHLALIALEQERWGYWTSNITRYRCNADGGEVVTDILSLEHCRDFLSRDGLLRTVGKEVLPSIDTKPTGEYFSKVLRTANEFMERYYPTKIRQRMPDGTLRHLRFDNGYRPPTAPCDEEVISQLIKRRLTPRELEQYFGEPIKTP